MKKIIKIASIALVGLTLSSVSNAWMTQSTPNIYGGYDFHDFGSGSFMQSTPNIYGGYDYHQY